MPPVTVLPRLEAERKNPQANEVCISITNPRQSPARLDGWEGILRLGFHDVDEPAPGYPAMTLAQACALLEFVKGHTGKAFTVHCEYGFSRSVAVGVFLAAWLQQDLTVEVLNPNPWVIQTLCRAGWRRALKWRDWRLLKVSLIGPRQFLKPGVWC